MGEECAHSDADRLDLVDIDLPTMKMRIADEVPSWIKGQTGSDRLVFPLSLVEEISESENMQGATK